MNPILASKAKDLLYLYEKMNLNPEAFLLTPEAAALLSGEDWKEDGVDAIEFGKWLNIHCKVRQTTDGGITWLYYRDGDLKPMGKFFTDELYKEYRKSFALPEPPKP